MLGTEARAEIHAHRALHATAAQIATNQTTRRLRKCTCVSSQVNTAKPEGMKDALRSLRSRLKSQHVGAQMKSLSLLEMLVKNCGPELHLQVATKEFMGDLTYLTRPGNADGRVSRKVLQLLHAWGEAFKEMRRDIPLFYDTYQLLCAQGIEFPPFDPSIAPSFVGGPSNASARGGSAEWLGDQVSAASTGELAAGRGNGREAAVTGLSGAAVFDVKLLNADLNQVVSSLVLSFRVVMANTDHVYAWTLEHARLHACTHNTYSLAHGHEHTRACIYTWHSGEC